MHSKHSDGKMFFHTDLTRRGPADTIDMPPHSDVYLIPPDDKNLSHDTPMDDRNMTSRALPTNGFRYRLIFEFRTLCIIKF